MPIDNQPKSPCLECLWHLKGGDKNRPECETCEDRLDFVRSSDPSASMAGGLRPVHPEGYGSGSGRLDPVGPGKEGDVCTYPGCGRPAGYDGYCHICRRRTRNRIRKGKDIHIRTGGGRPEDRERRERVLAEYRKNPQRPKAQLAEEFGVSERSIYNYVREERLKQQA